jgi:hypothetical protein
MAADVDISALKNESQHTRIVYAEFKKDQQQRL